MKTKIHISNNYRYTNKRKKSTIRIIAGKWKGKKIFLTNHQYLRPTTDQIRETLFNWLTPVIYGANCLDCFAGSGSLGIEALSRYANMVTFLEKNKTFSKKLNGVIQQLNIQQYAKVININSNIWLTNTTTYTHITQPYNIIFLDPPFKTWHYNISNIISSLEKFQYLAKDTWIYIEYPQNDTDLIKLIPNDWKLHKKKPQVTFPTDSIPNLKYSPNKFML